MAVHLDKAIRIGVTEAFADGVNSGFYVNRTSLALLASVLEGSCLCSSCKAGMCCCACGLFLLYTTKPNPGVGSVLEMLRQGVMTQLDLHPRSPAPGKQGVDS